MSNDTSVIELTQDMARLIAGELADIVRQRIAQFTPVTDGYEAVILAYTLRTFNAMEEIAGLLPGFDIREVKEKLATELGKAQDAGFWVDLSISQREVK